MEKGKPFQQMVQIQLGDVSKTGAKISRHRRAHTAF
jgi:hypothetical protein